MKFLVLLTEEDSWGRWERLTEDEQQDVFARFGAFTEAVAARGSVVAGEALDSPDRARTVRPGPVGADRPVTDGPFAETVEEIGGFWVVDVPDLDTALAAASLLPETCSVEVRPVVDLGD